MASLKTLVIACRTSPLAVRQAEIIRDHLVAACQREGATDIRFVIKTYKTTGDIRLSGTLADIGGKGLFTKEIEEALLARDADIAVHSMKDMPARMPPGLMIGAIPERDAPQDAFLSPMVDSPWDLPHGAVLGTASVRRAAQALHRRPDLKIVPLRGNVKTRLRKLEEGHADGMFLAEAGLRRLGMEAVERTILTPEQMLPALAQGALCLQLREEDRLARTIAGLINCPDTERLVAVERSFLQRLDGSCRSPMAGLAETTESGGIRFRAELLSPSGRDAVRREMVISAIGDRDHQMMDAIGCGADCATALYEAAGSAITDVLAMP